MGLFGKKSEAQRRVEQHASSIASAVWKAAAGLIGADFIDFVVDGCRDDLRASFGDLEAEKGEQAALKIALKRAAVIAKVAPNRIPGLEREIERIMRTALNR